MQAKLDFLGSLPIFTDLRPQELIDLARIVDAYEIKKGAILAYQGNVADEFYMIREGRLMAYNVDRAGIVTGKKVYNAGDYFNDEWLFMADVHTQNVRAVIDSKLYVLNEEEFLVWIEEHPAATLDMSARAWEELEQSRASTQASDLSRYALLPGELIEYESLRTRLLLLFELVPPLLFAIIAPILVGLLLTQVLELQFGLLVVGICLLFVLPPLLLLVYRYLDWANDYLLITNKHLVHKEFDLRTFQGQVLKIPLDQIQAIRILKPNWVETFVGVGTVTITTASQNRKLVFDKISNPQEVEKTLRVIRGREQKLDKGRTRAAVRALIENQFEIPRQIVEIPEESGDAAPSKKKKGGGGRVRRRGDRFVHGNTLTYGRHWIVLAQSVWWVVLLMIATIIAAIFLWVTLPGAQIPFTIVATIFVLLLESGIYYFYYENWANDLFQVTGDSVIDIDRGPFGLTESKKVAQIINIQNVRTEQLNIIAALFNYGDVIVDTAGTDAEIVFENVVNPALVQADIFERRELLIKSRRARDAASRRKEFTLMLQEYQELRNNRIIADTEPNFDQSAEDPAE